MGNYFHMLQLNEQSFIVQFSKLIISEEFYYSFSLLVA